MEADLRSHGASSSRHIIHIDLNKLPSKFDLNEVPFEFEEEELQSFVLGDIHNNIPINPPNPNCETCPLSNKRPRTSLRLKKTKKQRSEEAVMEDGESSHPPTPEWIVEAMKDKVEDVRLVYKKSLSESDVNPNLSRLLIPFKELQRNDFLTETESFYLKQDKDEEGTKPGLGVFLVNQMWEKWGLLFKRCEMKKKKRKKNKKKIDSQKSTLNYVLNCGWNEVVKGNGLKAKDNIYLWSFRSKGVLSFALSIK